MQSNESETSRIAVSAATASTDGRIRAADRVRYQVLASACSLAVITYLHRVGFATASAEFKTPLGLTDDDLGWLMAAFMIGYGLFEMPWGFLGDGWASGTPSPPSSWAARRLTALLVLVGFLPPQVVLIVGFLVLVRFLFGAFQAGTFPSISRMMADWMPSTERGSAQGAIWMSSRIGGRLAPLVLVWLFAVTGRLEAAGGAPRTAGHSLVRPVLALVSQPARRDAAVNEAERKLIAAGRAAHAGACARARSPGLGWRGRKASGLSASCTASSGFSGNFYLTLLPTYLKHHRHLDSQATAWLTSLPFAFGVVACLVGGSLSDAIIRRWGKAWSRRLVGVAGLSPRRAGDSRRALG